MTLDVIVATHNRALLLSSLLASIESAARPSNFTTRLLVVDNNSSDATKDVVVDFARSSTYRVEYLFEPQQGKAYALNRGLTAASAELVGFLDDDERIAPDWIKVVEQTFRDPGIGFASGPYRPLWETAPPAWLPHNYPAVIGWIDGGNRVLEYGNAYEGTMMGGNAVVRRTWIDRIGRFNVALGPVGVRKFAGEDVDYCDRLLEAGARGLYIPDLVIYHHIPHERLSKRYHRSWCFTRGLSLAVLNEHRPQPVRYLFGVPRYLFGGAMRGLRSALSPHMRRTAPAEAFSGELAVWDLVGFIVGKWRRLVGANGRSYSYQPPERSASRTFCEATQKRRNQVPIPLEDVGPRDPDDAFYARDAKRN